MISIQNYIYEEEDDKEVQMGRQEENKQVATFLIQKGWMQADKVVYQLEVAQSSELSLLEELSAQVFLNQDQVNEIRSFLQIQGNSSTNASEPIPGYKIQGKLGEGGMGSVYKAIHVKTNNVVAIKILSQECAEDEEYVQRFMREARNMVRLNNPHIVRAFRCGQVEKLYYLIMEFVDGCCGYDWLLENEATEKEIIQIGGQVAYAMIYYGQLNMVHRDIKPDNILLTKNNVAKLCDLGLAKREKYDAKITATGVILGTPHYISPEQASGDPVDIRSDIYSLGATLFHMAAREEPYTGKNVIAIMQKHLYADIPSLRDYTPRFSDKLDQIIQKMLAKEAGDRFQTPKELYDSFRTLLSGGVKISNTTIQPDGTSKLSSMPKPSPPSSSSHKKKASERNLAKQKKRMERKAKQEEESIWIWIVGALIVLGGFFFLFF